MRYNNRYINKLLAYKVQRSYIIIYTYVVYPNINYESAEIYTITYY